MLSYITESSAKEYNIIPLAINDGILEIGIVDPTVPGLRDAIRFIW